MLRTAHFGAAASREMSDDAMHDAHKHVQMPLIPGMGLNDGPTRARPRTQGLDFVNGIPGPFDNFTNRPPPVSARAPGKGFAPAAAPAAAAAPWEKHDPTWGALGRPRTANRPSYASGDARKPAWLAFDGLTLTFSGFFEDLETTARTGMRRVRKCVITYHLEDGTLDVREPRGVNSGILQGPILRRMRVDKPDGSPFEPLDFNVGVDVVIFSRTYSILACDAFTRDFLTREGATVPPDVPFPVERDPAPPKGTFPSAPSLIRAADAPPHLSSLDLDLPPPSPLATADAMGLAPGSVTKAALALKESKGRQFLELDGRVLRFFATAEGGRPGGDDVRNARASRAFVVHYFLADDTVEVLEVLPRNSGMGDFPKILRRQKLPKPTEGGGYGVGIRPAGEDTMRRRERDTYSWRDLKIGEVISSYGLILTLRDCDAHTRDWYESELGMDPERDFEAMAPPPGPPPIVRQPPPPHVSGIGSERDSLESCYRLVPKPPKTVDYDQWAMNQGQVMRFTATIVPRGPPGSAREVDEIDRDRSFVVSFFLEDDTLSVYEPPVPNSGLPGGPFLQRRATKKNPSGGSGSAYLRARDMYVGAVIEVSGRSMRLNAADDSTHAAMERRPAEFPRSDPAKVKAKLRAAVAALGLDAAAELKRVAAAEDAKLGGGGAMVLNRGSFLELACGAPGLEAVEANGADAQSLHTLWRSLPKFEMDLGATRKPASVDRAALEEEYVRIPDVFEALGVAF